MGRAPEPGPGQPSTRPTGAYRGRSHRQMEAVEGSDSPHSLAPSQACLLLLCCISSNVPAAPKLCTRGSQAQCHHPAHPVP